MNARLFGVTGGSFLKIGTIALLFLLLFKWGARKSGIAGLQTVAAAA